MKRLPDLFVAASLAMIFASAAADTQNGERKWNPAEEWVVTQETAGKEADLREKFPNESDRKLSAHFLEDLLTGALQGVKPHRNGVRISGAILDEPIDLTDAHIHCRVWLADCQFMSSTIFMRASFEGTALFDGSTFKAGANFNSMKVGQNLFFRKAVFEGPVEFVAAEVAGSFVAEEAQFNNKEQEADFNSMKVGGTVFLSKAVFEGPVEFVLADVVGNFEAKEAQFKNNEQASTFNKMKVGGIALFTKSMFEGRVDFNSADVGNFEANEAQFKNKEQTSSFNSMKVRQNLFLSKAVFEGPVEFIWADVGNFEANEAQFKNKDRTSSFNSMRVRQNIFFRKAVFEGPVEFVAADVGGSFVADEAQFNNKEQEADFNTMKVGGTVFLSKAVFEGPVEFTWTEVIGNFQANEAQFKNKKQEADCSGMKVGHTALFSKTVFEGPVELSFSDFGILNLSNWVCRGPLYLQGMNYKEIRAGPLSDESISHEALLTLVRQSTYRADVYGNLEQFFLRQGYRGDADRAFIAGKRREREENLHGLHWVGSWLLDWLVGYGRRPWQAGIPCLFLVALGCFLFSPKRMEPQKPEDIGRVYNRFWYSLGLFLPFVDLQADKVWKPKPNQTFLRNYMRVHILAGWILVPLVLAALTGLIK